MNSIISEVLTLADELTSIQKFASNGTLPYRITHNDTKLNNVLFDAKAKAKCVVDLDTVMPGLVHYDFGDGIRTSASTAKEDEQDITLVEIDLEKFNAFSHGYLEATREVLIPEEIHLLPESASLLALLMATRFLADHLVGDKYYKVNYEGHNLVRAKCQLQLAKTVLKRKADLAEIINGLYRR